MVPRRCVGTIICNSARRGTGGDKGGQFDLYRAALYEDPSYTGGEAPRGL